MVQNLVLHQLNNLYVEAVKTNELLTSIHNLLEERLQSPPTEEELKELEENLAAFGIGLK